MADPRTHIYSNNATSRLASDVSIGAGTITVTPGDGALFPDPAYGEIFVLTVEDLTEAAYEIMFCTERTGDVLTVERGCEGTSALAFTTQNNVVVQHRVTAGTLEHLEEAVAEAANAGGLAVRGASWISPLGSAIATPVNDVYVRCPRSGVFQKATIGTTGGVGSCSVDIWKDTHANFPPDVSDSVCNAGQPFITSGIKYESTDFSAWRDNFVTEGDWLVFHLVTSSVFTGIFVSLFIEEE